MAQFRAVIEGKRGAASRLGSANSGIVAHVNGWDLGVRVRGEVNGDSDEFTVILTGGSHAAINERVVGRIFIDPKHGPTFRVIR